MNNWELHKGKLNTIMEELKKEHPYESYSEIKVMAITTLVNRNRNKAVFDIFDAIDWLAQEAESEDYMRELQKEHLAEIKEMCKDNNEKTSANNFNGVMNGFNTGLEPQQSKEKFIKIAEDFAVNPNHISAIGRNTEDAEITDIWVSGKHFTVDVDYITLCNQLGIEVV